MTPPRPEGFHHLEGYLSGAAQVDMLEAVRDALAMAPYFRPSMPGTAQPLSVKMTNFGSLGWVTDKTGYRYEPRHPVTKAPWPPIPPMVLDVWHRLSETDVLPEACLVNFYNAEARLGLHKDATEDKASYTFPVISISLGKAATFRLGGLARTDPCQSIRLHSGDVVVLGGKSRLAYHGVSRILKNSTDPVDVGGRINLTMRRVRGHDDTAI